MTQLPARMLVVFGFALGMAACAPAEAPAPADTTAEDTAAISALRNAWTAAYNAQDANALGALYAEDAVRMDGESPTTTGRDNIQAAMAAQLSESPATITLTSDETQLMGDRAFDRGTFSATVTPEGGGDAMTLTGRYLVLLQKQADGSWKLTHTIDNTSAPPTAMMAE